MLKFKTMPFSFVPISSESYVWKRFGPRSRSTAVCDVPLNNPIFKKRKVLRVSSFCEIYNIDEFTMNNVRGCGCINHKHFSTPFVTWTDLNEDEPCAPTCMNWTLYRTTALTFTMSYAIALLPTKYSKLLAFSFKWLQNASNEPRAETNDYFW